jgi:hypothetical protein
MEVQTMADRSDSEEEDLTFLLNEETGSNPIRKTVIDITTYNHDERGRKPPEIVCMCMRLQRDGIPCSHLISLVRTLQTRDTTDTDWDWVLGLVKARWVHKS